MIVLTETGTIISWGDDTYGSLGRGDNRTVEGARGSVPPRRTLAAGGALSYRDSAVTDRRCGSTLVAAIEG